MTASRNSFKHGLDSQDLIIQDDDPAEFDHLRSALSDEHQPANHRAENLDAWCNNGLFALINPRGASVPQLERSEAIVCPGHTRPLSRMRSSLPAKRKRFTRA